MRVTPNIFYTWAAMNGQLQKTVSQIAQRARCSRNGVDGAIKVLHAAGLIEKSNSYPAAYMPVRNPNAEQREIINKIADCYTQYPPRNTA